MLSTALGASRSVARTPVDPLDEFAGECDAFLEVFGVEVLDEGVGTEGLGAGEWDARKSSCCSSLELAGSYRVVVMASVAVSGNLLPLVDASIVQGLAFAVDCAGGVPSAFRSFDASAHHNARRA